MKRAACKCIVKFKPCLNSEDFIPFSLVTCFGDSDRARGTSDDADSVFFPF